MNNYFRETSHKLETAINELEIEADYSIQRIEAVINLILECLSELREYILEKGFKNKEAEIHFFRHQKPIIVAKLVYYNAIYKIETKKPHGAKPLKKYLNRELKKLKRYFDNNLDFYKYYNTLKYFETEDLAKIGWGIKNTEKKYAEIETKNTAALAIEMGADAVDIGKTIHPHPTLGESIGMAAEVAHGSCTDVPPARK